jgi:ferredoxin
VNNVSEVFRLKDHDKAEVYDPGGAYEATIQQEAIDICPVSCIQWLE